MAEVVSQTRRPYAAPQHGAGEVYADRAKPTGDGPGTGATTPSQACAGQGHAPGRGRGPGRSCACEGQARSKRSRFITLVQALAKSCANFACESAAP